MAITVQAKGTQRSTLTVSFVDYLFNSASSSYPVEKGVVEGDIITFLTALDALTSAKICGYTIDNAPFDVDGQQAVTDNVAFNDVYNRANLLYVSADYCKDKIEISIPAPIPALFAGANKQLVDTTNADLATFNTAYEAIAVSKAGATDMVFNHGYRSLDALPKPNVF